MNKKAKVDLAVTWAEIVSFILLIIGFVLAYQSGSAVITYIVSFLSGLMFGKLWYSVKRKEKYAYFIMIVFFLIGFVLGSFHGDKRLIIIFYVLGIMTNYYLYNKHILR